VFSPDGQRILTASWDQTASWDKTARVWDLSGKLQATLQGHTGTVTSAVFSPDGQCILTASDDQTARVWDLSGKLQATLQGHTGIVTSAVFSPDGRRILTASDDSTARIYLVRVEDLLAVAACRVPRGLTEEEINRFDVGTPRFDIAKRQCPPALKK
jgi:WD40 repeat protein